MPEIIVDLFAGGGGTSTGIEQALGFPPHVAINHDEEAISMHRINHPFTRHYVSDVFEVCPRDMVISLGNRPVAALHLSPDCTHHSQARGGQPRDRKIRALSWIGLRWAGQVRPRFISLENVAQILKWGPLIAKRDKKTGRVTKLDGTIAKPGERTPIELQYLVPDPKRAGQTWNRFVSMLKGLGYIVEWRQLVAADYGTPTTRKRLFMLARCDGQPIVWPKATHAAKPEKGLKQWRSAAECIDFADLGTSIFSRKKPLADATMRRIALGMQKYVLNNASPFIIQTGYGERERQAPRVPDINTPLGTAVAGGVKHAIVSPVVIQASHGDGKPGGVQRWGTGCKGSDTPIGTITAGGGDHAIATAYFAHLRNNCDAKDVDAPLSTLTSGGGHHGLITAHMTAMSQNVIGTDLREPMQTVLAGATRYGLVSAYLSSYYTDSHDRCRPMEEPAATITTENRLGLVQCQLSEDDKAGALQVAAFLMRYYGEGGQWADLKDPTHAITTKDRLALVTVFIGGTPYVIVDICLRMLKPRELYKAQGFPTDYIIDHGYNRPTLSKTAQVRMVGNSVPPPVIDAIYRTNLPELAISKFNTRQVTA